MPLAMLCHRGLSFYESALSSTLPRQPAGLRPCQIAVVSALTFELEPKCGDLRLDPTGPISISSTSNPIRSESGCATTCGHERTVNSTMDNTMIQRSPLCGSLKIPGWLLSTGLIP